MSYLTEQTALHEDSGASRKNVLVETTSVQFELIEAKTPGGPLRARGEFGYAGRPTGNKRLYTEKLTRREVGKLQKAISERKVLGELDHPGNGRSSLDRVSHVITSLKVEDNGRVVGEYEILPTTCGKNLEAIIRAGCKVGVSSRGFGTTEMDESGNQVVNDDYRLLTYDVVIDPADSDAYPQVVREHLEESNGAGFDVSLEEKLAEAFREGCEVGASEMEAKATDRWASEVRSYMESLRAEIRSEVEAEMGALPGASLALRAVQEALAPFMLPAHYRRIVDETAADALRVSQANTLLSEELAAATSMARESTYLLVLQRRYGAKPAMLEKVQAQMGDLTLFESVEAFEHKLTEVANELLTERVAELEQRQGASARVGLDAYVQKRLRLHPLREQLGRLITRAQPDTVEAVDALIEGFEPRRQSSLLEQFRESVSGDAGQRGRARSESSVPLKDRRAESSGLSEAGLDTE